MQWTREFPSRPASVAGARHFLMEVLPAADSGLDREAVTLMLSELASNAVRHARGATFTVSIVQASDALRVGVTDDDPEPPVLRKTRGDYGGLGLPLLEQLSEQWGVTMEQSGKCVWFRVRFG